MHAWLWITAAALVAFAVFIALGRRWWRVKWLLDWLLVLSVPRWWYSWRHAAHVMEETAAEYGPGAFYGSMDVTAEQALHHELPWWPAPTVDPEPWLAQMTAELSPEALDDDEPLSPPPPSHPVWRNPRLDDPGPGDAAVEPPASSGPDHCEDRGAPTDEGHHLAPPSRWLAGQLEILRAWSERHEAYAEILA